MINEVFSDEWLTDLAHRASLVNLEDQAVSVTLQQHVGAASWYAHIAHGAITITRGVATMADATMTQSLATATAIASGELSSQQCFIDGRVQLTGDANALIQARPWLVALDALA